MLFIYLFIHSFICLCVYFTDKTKLKLDREVGGGDLVLNGGAEV